MKKLNSWLDPTRRQQIRAWLPMALAVLAGFGVITQQMAVIAGAIIVATFDLVIAAMMTRSEIRKTSYLLAVAISAGLVTWGIMTDGQAQLILAAVNTLLGILLARQNTDVTTPDGTPKAELA